MRIQFLALSLFLTTVGCTHQRAVLPVDTESVVELNQRAASHAVMVTLKDGAVYEGRALQMMADSTSWLTDSQGVKSVATGNVAEIEVKDRGRGALEGLALGVALGSLTGALIGWTDGDDPPCERWCFFQMTAGDKAQLFGMAFGMLGGLSGLVRGAVQGSRDVYEIKAEVEPRIAVAESEVGTE